MYPPVGYHDIGGGRLERRGRQRSNLSLEPDGPLVNRRARDGGAPAAECANGVGRLVRIAIEDPDLVEREAEGIGGKLGPGGLVTLAVRGRPGDHGDGPVGFELDCSPILGKSGGFLDVGRDPDPPQAAALARGLLRAP